MGRCHTSHVLGGGGGGGGRTGTEFAHTNNLKVDACIAHANVPASCITLHIGEVHMFCMEISLVMYVHVNVTCPRSCFAVTSDS